MSEHKCPHKIFRRIGLLSGFFRGAGLVCVFFITLIICHCSKVVDITLPGDGDSLPSAHGTCVVCHTNAEMIQFVADPMPEPEQEGA